MRRRAALAAVLLAAAAVVGAACGDGGGGEGGAGEGEDAVERTTIQLRPVIGRAGDCKEHSENPPADEPTALALTGRCVGLAPSVLTIKRAGVREVVAQNGVSVAQVKLGGKDGQALAEVSRQFVGKELGLVAFGRLLVAAVVNEEIASGELEILGLSKSEIEDLRRALAP